MATRTVTPRAAKAVEPDRPPTPEGWVNASENPELANAAIAAALADTEMPVIPLPADDLVNLPGGILRDGYLHKSVQVKELTGEDEEALARAAQSPNAFHFLDRLIRCGSVKVGSLPEHETETILPDLLVGDREAIILGIRRATYGDTLKIDQWVCPKCGINAELTMTTDRIPSRELGKNIEIDGTFKVSLRKGGTATCHLATGADQLATYEKDNLTTVERQTILLTRCIETITQPTGLEQHIEAFPSLVRHLSMPDRHEILRQLDDKQPGPRFNGIDHVCATCGEAVTVVLGIGDLFPDIGWF